MFNKTKLKIKDKLSELLQLEMRNDSMINAIVLEMDDREKKYLRRISNLEHKNKVLFDNISKLNEKEESLHRTIQSILNIGVDADIPNNRGISNSWGVICYNHGNNPIVKFLDLRRENGKDITNYLKQFDSANFKFDSPYRMMMEEDLLSMWFNK